MTRIAKLLLIVLLLVSAVRAEEHSILVSDPIRVSRQNFDESLRQAVIRAAKEYRPVMLPGGWVYSDKVFTNAIRDPKPAAKKPWKLLIDNVTIYGNHTIIKRRHKERAMWRLYSPHNWHIEGPLTFDGQEKEGEQEVIGIHVPAAWKWNRNGGHYCRLQQVKFLNMRNAIWLGDPFGPDHRGWTLSGCIANRVVDAFVFQGANVTSIKLDNCQATNYWRSGIRSIGTSNKSSFKDETITNPWGDPYAVDSFNSDKWKGRLHERSWGWGAKAGCPKVNVDVFDAVSHYDHTTQAIWCDLGALEANSVRVEGRNNNLCLSAGKPYRRGVQRRETILRDCTVSKASTGYVIDHQGGRPLVIDGGVFFGKIRKSEKADLRIVGSPYVGGNK